MRVAISVFSVFLLAACAEQGAAPGVTSSAEASQPAFVGEAWLRTDANAEPGSMMIFLESGILVQTACVSPYRLSQWQSGDGNRVSWSEDGIPIEADLRISGNRMTLEFTMDNGPDNYEFEAADSEKVCPSLPR